MRLAVVSDIHGNLSALEAVVADLRRQSPDLVVHGGDLALMGASPAEVVDRIRELGWQGVVGNTDELLWRPEEQARLEEAAPKLAPLMKLLFEDYAPLVAEALGEERIAWLRELPTELRVDDLLLLHASPGNLWRAPTPDERRTWSSTTGFRGSYDSITTRNGKRIGCGPSVTATASGWPR